MRVSRCGGKLFCSAIAGSARAPASPGKAYFTKNMLTQFCFAIAGSARTPTSPGRAYFTKTTRLEKALTEKGKIVLC